MESTADRRPDVTLGPDDDVRLAVDTTSREQPSSSRMSFRPRALFELLKRPSLLITDSVRRKSLRYAAYICITIKLIALIFTDNKLTILLRYRAWYVPTRYIDD